MSKKDACKTVFCDIIDSFIEKYLSKLNQLELLDECEKMRLEFAKRTCGRPFHREKLAIAIVFAALWKHDRELKKNTYLGMIGMPFDNTRPTTRSGTVTLRTNLKELALYGIVDKGICKNTIENSNLRLKRYHTKI